MDASTTAGFVSTMVTSTGSVLTSGIPAVLGLAASLIGLGFLIRFVKKHVGRKA